MSAPLTRIQQKNRSVILEAALEVFSKHGFRGATIDQIAEASGLSKPNLLYYFPSKTEIHARLLSGLLDTWLDPLRAMDPDGDPLTEVLDYVQRKLQISRDYPRESRLFANEILQGAPHIHPVLTSELKPLVDQKATLIQSWIDDGKLAPVHPYHLLFSIWSQTQHYADFDVQIRAVMDREDPFDAAAGFVDALYRRLLQPQ